MVPARGAVSEYLTKEKNFTYYSLSDVVRKEVLKKDTSVTREKLITTANMLRRAEGPSVLADRIITCLDLAGQTVVDSFRNPEEVMAFRRLNGFELWCVAAQKETRFERIKARKRENDPRTLKEFIRIEEKELTSDDPSRQNLNACQKMADRTLLNNNTLDGLHKQIDNILKT